MKKTVISAYFVLFAVIMCLPHAIYLPLRRFVDTTNYEKREYEVFPSGESIFDGTFGERFEKFYNDRLPFRNQLIKLNNKLNYYLFRSTIDDKVMVGKDGWLFLSDVNEGNPMAGYKGENLLNEEELKAATDNMIANYEYLKSKGIEFVVMVPPNKSTVYSDYMPDYMGEPAEVNAASQVIDCLSKNTDIKIVNELDPILEVKSSIGEKMADHSVYLYHKCDSHWNNLGAYVGATELLQKIGIDMPELTNRVISITPVANTECDLAQMLHMSDDFVDREWNYKINGYEDNNVRLLNDDFSGVIEYESDAKDKRTVYICRDSFGSAIGEYIGSQFAHTYMRHVDSFYPEEIDEVKPDVVVLEIVERNAAYRFATFSLSDKKD